MHFIYNTNKIKNIQKKLNLEYYKLCVFSTGFDLKNHYQIIKQ